MKKIAILGSSGGNLYNLGGKEPLKLLGEIITQANSASIEVEDIVFVGAFSTLDKVNDNSEGRLFTFESGEIIATERMLLKEINELAEIRDAIVAEKILNNEIDGLVLVSSDPENVNKKTVEAAAKMKTPIVGTGGTSMANVQSKGGNVIAVSGTTGTTNRTRAISAISTLSKNFGLKYRPIIGTAGPKDSPEQGTIRDRISLRGIMMSSLPGFIAMAILLALSKIPIFDSLSDTFNMLIGALPIIVAGVAAYQVSGLGEVGIVSGVVAGALSVDGGIIGGIAGGILAGILADYFIRKAFEFNMPGTTANIIAGGLSGLVAGLIIYFLLAPVALFAGDSVRNLIQAALDFNPIVAGALAGLLIWPAIMGGVYHAAILPIVLLEMETAGVSFLGAVDMVGLVMVSAGITLANVLSPVDEGDKAIALPGLLVNLGFGTFVEAAYPFMFANKLVFAGGLIASTVGGILIGFLGVQGTAYVPSLLAPGLSNNAIGFVISMVASMAIAFVFTVIANKDRKRKGVKNKW